MTSASPADTKVTGAVSVKREAVRAARDSMGDTLRKIGQPMLQATETEKATESDECSEWSNEETRVLQVCPIDKGEVSFLHTPFGATSLANKVRGRLKSHIAFWERIDAPEFILDTIRHGYKIPFIHEPTRMVMTNNNSAHVHRDFVEEAIQELVESSRISEVRNKAQLHVINPLSVSVQASGKKRLILDLRKVNQCLHKQKFKFEDYKHAIAYFRPGCFFTKFDLKSGYHHVEIFPNHRRYLGFAWKFNNGKSRYFMFNVLPFGLSTAPYIFTKLLRPLVKLWRSRGFHPVVYLDDGLNIEDSLEQASTASHHTKGDLHAAGFIVAEEKTIWQPVQYIDWLGIRWNSVDGSISIVEKRVNKAKKSIKETIKKSQTTARELASVVGSIISMSVVFGRVARIMTRHCQITVAAADAWDTQQTVDDYCRLELRFWDSHLEKFNKKHCFLYPTNNKIIYSDASSYACGALIQKTEQSICHKMFTPEEVGYSSTHRELITILYSLRAFGNILHNSSIKWYTDNQATAKIVDVGSMRLVLQKVAYEIFTYCLGNHIDLHIEWIPRALNRQADFMSKIRDCDDWQTTRELFDQLNSIWGPYTVDCFSSSCNNKVDKLYSRFWNPGCAGMDALYQAWGGGKL